MTRRFLIPLATGVVCLVAISPVLAAEQSTPAANKTPAKATTTTASPDDSGANPGTDSGPTTDDSGSTSDSTDPGSSDNTGTTGKGSSGSTATTGSGSGSGAGGGQRSTSMCDPPETNKEPAPQMGDAPQTFEAGEAGNVEVERLSDTELRVVKATANDGWNQQVATPSGPRVTVKFTRQGESPTLIRFAASMDQKGTMIHTRVTSCG
jgi:hypothetical protein